MRSTISTASLEGRLLLKSSVPQNMESILVLDNPETALRLWASQFLPDPEFPIIRILDTEPILDANAKRGSVFIRLLACLVERSRYAAKSTNLIYQQ